MSPLCASVSPSAKQAFPGTHVAEFLSPARTHMCKVLPRLQGLWSGQPGPTRRTRGGEGWGRHSAPRGGGPPPQHPQPRREISRGVCLGGETSPGSCHWKPLFLAAPGRRGSASAGSDYPHGLQSVLRWRPLPSAEPARPADVTPLPATCQAGLRGGGCPDRDSNPHPAHSPACCGLSSSARLLMGTPGPGPPPWHCRSSFQHLETHPPCPLYYGTQTSRFLCVQIW